MKTTILLVDDHPIFREGLRSLIDNCDTTVVVGEAGNGAEAVRLVGELKPDLVIMDLTMPIMNGIDATREITKNFPDTRVLALSMESDRFFVVEALKAGATGYLLKDTVFNELSEAISIVAGGDTYLPRKISTLLVKEFLQCVPEDMTLVYQNLTPRERQILQLIADGKCIKEIAHNLGVSNKTVENQRQHIMHKLNLFTVAELTKYAIRSGLSPLK
ncbi:MAG: response regulator transcription factor [Desulfuromonadales bacterium]|nr:response regulator transcription factor [Desulfuromonadales bacterium]